MIYQTQLACVCVACVIRISRIDFRNLTSNSQSKCITKTKKNSWRRKQFEKHFNNALLGILFFCREIHVPWIIFGRDCGGRTNWKYIIFFWNNFGYTVLDSIKQSNLLLLASAPFPRSLHSRPLALLRRPQFCLSFSFSLPPSASIGRVYIVFVYTLLTRLNECLIVRRRKWICRELNRIGMRCRGQTEELKTRLVSFTKHGPFHLEWFHPKYIQ